MKKVLKLGIFCIAAISLFLVGIYAIGGEYTEDTLDNLIILVNDLIIQRDAENPLGADSRLVENLHLHQYFENIMTGQGRFSLNLTPSVMETGLANGFDARLALVTEFQRILREAILTLAGEDILMPHLQVVIAWAGPNPWAPEQNFTIFFRDERYFPLARIIADFAGIPEYLIDLKVTEPNDIIDMGRVAEGIDRYGFSDYPRDIYYPCDADYPWDIYNPWATYYLEDSQTASPMTVFSMGMPISFFVPGNPLPIGTGTLGHPTNVTGRFAYTTNHGIIPVGTEVRTTVFHGNRPIGRVVAAIFDPASGIDVSRIEFFNGFINPQRMS